MRFNSEQWGEWSEWGPTDRDLYDRDWVDPERRRTKEQHPYTYDEFFIFGSRDVIGKDGTHADYSDRLFQWDSHKFETLWKEHVGCRWSNASEGQLSRFISAYHGRTLMVVALAEGCNPSSGYPYWIIWYR